MKLSQYKSVVPFLILLYILLPVLFIPKHQSFLFINGLHHPTTDILFKNITWLGEGFMVICCAIIALFLKLRWLAAFIFGLIIHALLIQINKQYLFNDVYRPSVYLNWMGLDHLIHFVEGVRIRREVSFPSGHTTGAAFAASFLALILDSKRASVKLVIIATAVGISRVYLAQHFVIDIYFGLFFGVLSSCIGLLVADILHPKCKWMNNFIIPETSRKLKPHFMLVKEVFSKGFRSSLKF